MSSLDLRSVTGSTVKVGETVSFTASGNATTGYSWREVLKPANVSVSINYVSDPNPHGLCGVGGRFIVSITGVTEGVAEVGFAYCRGPVGDPEVTFKVDVTA